MTTKPRLPIFQRGHPLARGLVGAWLFYERSGTTVHDTAGRNGIATISNGSWSSLGNLALNGTSTIIQGENAAFAALEKVSIVYAATPASTHESIDGGYVLLVGPITDIVILLYERTVSGTQLAFRRDWGSVAEWHSNSGAFAYGSKHTLAVTYDGSSTLNDPLMYKNGETIGLSEAAAPSGALNTATPQFDIGNRRSDSARGYNGELEYLYIFNRVLTSVEVRALYTDPYQAFRPRPAWYPVVFDTTEGAAPEPPAGDVFRRRIIVAS